jgi:putative Holliday junction resolvase
MSFDNRVYLGVDWGEKRIGLALADGELRIATPFKTVANLKELAVVAKEEMVDILVLGKPMKMRGEEDGLNPDFLKFFDDLEGTLPDVKIELIDERLTSQEADARVGDKKIKASRDEVAAMIILQNYLDKLEVIN